MGTLKQDAEIIKTEDNAGLNTASRIGSWMEKAADEIDKKPSLTNGKLPASVMPDDMLQESDITQDYYIGEQLKGLVAGSSWLANHIYDNSHLKYITKESDLDSINDGICVLGGTIIRTTTTAPNLPNMSTTTTQYKLDLNIGSISIRSRFNPNSIWSAWTVVNDTSAFLKPTITTPVLGDTLVYDGAKWLNKTKKDLFVEQQLAMGNWCLPVVPSGQTGAAIRFVVGFKVRKNTMLYATGGVEIYGDAALTTPLKGSTELLTTDTLNGRSIHVAFLPGQSSGYLILENGLSLIEEYKDSGYSQPPMSVEYYSTFPPYVTNLNLQATWKGSIDLDKMPSALNILHIDWVASRIVGSLQNLPSTLKQLTIANSNNRNPFTNDIAALLNKGLIRLHITHTNDFTYTSGNSYAQTFSYIQITSRASWTTAMTDSFILELSASNWVASGGVLNLSGVAKHSGSTAVLNAISSLTAKNVTVTVNS